MGLAIALLSAATPGCFGPRFDRAAMLEGIATTVILPAHEALVREAERLDAAAKVFTAEPTGATLAALRDQWLQASVAWKGVQLFRFESLILLHNAIEKRPARYDFIDATIAQLNAGTREPIDAAFVEGAGATSKGLGAIEYLIFPSGVDDAAAAAAFAEPGRSAYLLATTANLVDKTHELLSFWAPEEGDYLTAFRENDSEGADVRGSMSRLANQIIEHEEIATQQSIGRPIGRTTDGIARAEDVEAPLSGRSLELVIARMESIRETIDAGLDDYLDYLEPGQEVAPLSRRIAEQFDVALDALRAIEGPLQVAVLQDPAPVEAAYEEMRALIVLLKTEMAGRLGITVTFTDGDGD